MDILSPFSLPRNPVGTIGLDWLAAAAGAPFDCEPAGLGTGASGPDLFDQLLPKRTAQLRMPSRRPDPVLKLAVPAGVQLDLQRAGERRWQAIARFECGFELDSAVQFVDRIRYEYRQHLRTRVRFTRDGRTWETLLTGDPDEAWVEDQCQINGQTRFVGRRPRSTAEVGCPGEAYDAPDATAQFGSRYRLARALDLAGEIPHGAVAIEVEIEVRGEVVEGAFDPDSGRFVERRTVSSRRWSCGGSMTVSDPV